MKLFFLSRYCFELIGGLCNLVYLLVFFFTNCYGVVLQVICLVFQIRFSFISVIYHFQDDLQRIMNESVEIIFNYGYALSQVSLNY